MAIHRDKPRYKTCPGCQIRRKEPCAKADCPKRKPITAAIPDGSTPISVTTGCSYKTPIRYED